MADSVIITHLPTGNQVVTGTQFNAFWWDEGNGSCDCNRRIEFFRAHGVSDDDIFDYEDEECSEGEFSAIFVGGWRA